MGLEIGIGWLTILLFGSLGLLLIIAGCVAAPPRTVAVQQATPRPDTNVYFYPMRGHAAPSPEQQDRDKFECNASAVQQTGFDPSLPNAPAHQRVRIIAGGPPAGTGVAVGAVIGAVVGGAVSNPWHAGSGMLIGALAGAAIGGVADAERSAQTERLQAQANSDANNSQAAALDQRAMDYRRAMTACLESRGYSVQ